MSSVKPERENWDGERVSQAQTFSFPTVSLVVNRKQQLTNISPLTGVCLSVCVCVCVVVKDYDHTQLVCVSALDPPMLLKLGRGLSHFQ